MYLELSDVQNDKEIKDNFSCVKYANFFGLFCDSKYRNFKDLRKNSYQFLSPLINMNRFFNKVERIIF
jgi:hypothetical protein